MRVGSVARSDVTSFPVGSGAPRAAIACTLSQAISLPARSRAASAGLAVAKMRCPAASSSAASASETVTPCGAEGFHRSPVPSAIAPTAPPRCIATQREREPCAWSGADSPFGTLFT